MTTDLHGAVRNNFIEKVCYVARIIPSMTVADYGNFISADCGLPSDTFNVIVVRNLLETRQLLMDGVGHFMEKRWPMALWYWENAVDSHEMETLTSYGLTHTESHIAMAVDGSQAYLPTSTPDGLVIKQATTEDDLKQYGSVLTALFGASDEAKQVAKYYDLLTQYPISNFPALRSYIGVYHGSVVATGSLFIGSDTIGIYDIVTRDDYRRLGIGSAMFAYLLGTAKRLQPHHMVLQASQDGIGIYRKAGFAPVGIVHTFENRGMLNEAP